MHPLVSPGRAGVDIDFLSIPRFVQLVDDGIVVEVKARQVEVRELFAMGRFVAQGITIITNDAEGASDRASKAQHVFFLEDTFGVLPHGWMEENPK